MKYSNVDIEVLKMMLIEYGKTIERAKETFGEEKARVVFAESFAEYDRIKIQLLIKQRKPRTKLKQGV